MDQTVQGLAMLQEMSKEHHTGKLQVSAKQVEVEMCLHACLHTWKFMFRDIRIIYDFT